ncbi:hypothetical protein SAMN05216548_1075 [Faunimonas pinastri]|uniref:Uncharacterized protein n=1 Tax=Faunimonas pinastri TaxID=1855383 RepID=A0A1H9I747_9HYPH|nr:hypothetical protein [Faunimonas pinastri]SEQ70393.1 hypothetical protein SAMN05216548_1075 [Faunimonas pinastri]
MITSSVVASGYRPARQRITTETRAALAGMTVQPSEKRILVYDTAIRSLKSAGIWSKLGWLSLLAAHDEQAGRLNLVAPAQVASAVNSPTFNADQGFSFDGASNYIDTGVLPSAVAVLTQNSAHEGVRVRTAGTSTQPLLGSSNATGIMYLWPRNASGVLAGRLNTSTAGTFGQAATRAGHSILTRADAAAISGYKDGALLGTSSVASVAPGTQTASITLGRGGTAAYADDQVSAFHVGAALTADDVAKLQTILTTYMKAVGAE